VPRKIKNPRAYKHTGIGKKIAQDLHIIGIHHVKDLIGQNQKL
jgi:predicted flap endonuclease-1-like 5' DNA nuclease